MFELSKLDVALRYNVAGRVHCQGCSVRLTDAEAAQGGHCVTCRTATRTGPSIEGNGDAHEPDESALTPVDFHKVFIAIAGVSTVLAALAWAMR